MAARKRELIQPHSGDKRFARHSKSGQFTTDKVDVGKSLNKDNNEISTRTVPKGKVTGAIRKDLRNKPPLFSMSSRPIKPNLAS
jgi:hypothetical protein